MSEEICYICNNKRKITKHHLFPVRYLRYLPSYWEIQNNKIILCKVCHRYFEQRVLSWYEQLEDSIKNTLTHKESQKLNSRYKGIFRHDILAKYEKLINSLENDRQRFKFIVLVMSQFTNIFNTSIPLNILSPSILRNCDNSLKEYLNR